MKKAKIIKIKNIYGEQINVQLKPLKVLEVREIEKVTQEIKNLVQQKYIELQ